MLQNVPWCTEEPSSTENYPTPMSVVGGCSRAAVRVWPRETAWSPRGPLGKGALFSGASWVPCWSPKGTRSLQCLFMVSVLLPFNPVRKGSDFSLFGLVLVSSKFGRYRKILCIK